MCKYMHTYLMRRLGIERRKHLPWLSIDPCFKTRLAYGMQCLYIRRYTRFRSKYAAVCVDGGFSCTVSEPNRKSFSYVVGSCR